MWWGDNKRVVPYLTLPGHRPGLSLPLHARTCRELKVVGFGIFLVFPGVRKVTFLVLAHRALRGPGPYSISSITLVSTNEPPLMTPGVLFLDLLFLKTSFFRP
jgi:hypothetical protein